jgi:hypothetical protein
MIPDKIGLFVLRDCAITYSLPLQKTLVEIEGEGELPSGYFDSNCHQNLLSNQWNFFFKNKNNEIQKKILNGDTIKSIRLKEENQLIYKISDTEFENNLFFTQRAETLRNYLFFYS